MTVVRSSSITVDRYGAVGPSNVVLDGDGNGRKGGNVNVKFAIGSGFVPRVRR